MLFVRRPSPAALLFAGAGAAFLLTVDVPGRGTGRGAVVGVVTVRAGDVYALVGTVAIVTLVTRRPRSKPGFTDKDIISGSRLDKNRTNTLKIIVLGRYEILTGRCCEASFRDKFSIKYIVHII